MAANKRTKFQIQQDRSKVISLYLHGRTQAEIASELGVTQPQVAYDLKAIQKEWRESRIFEINQFKSEQLARIDEIEREAWEAWKRSQQPRESTLQERYTGVEVKDRASIRKENQYGDPRFLERISWAVEQRLKIFGLYAPAKLDVATLDNILEAELQRLRALEDGDSSTNGYVN